MSGEIFSLEHQILYYETDLTGQLSIPMIFNLAILASAEQSETLGQGEDEIHAHNNGWVVLQYDLKITRRPRVGETVVIKTQAKEYNPYFAIRNFWLESASGDELVQIRSMFALISMEQRKMVRIPAEMMVPYQAEKVKHITKIAAPNSIDDTDNVKQKDYHVRYFDIDSNLHVNNAQYFDWLLDPLGAEFLQANEIKQLNIKYANEVRYGDEVTSYYQINKNNTKHQIKVGNTLNTEAEITWQSR